MIKVNELRIGNYILNDGCVCTIDQLNGKGFTYCGLITKQGNQITAHYDLIKPIPLTEELLLKCGWVRSFIEGLFRIESVEIEIIKGKFYPSISVGEYHIGKELKSLHQLQNLYFALTGEELEIKISE